MDWLHKKAFWMSLASIVDIVLKGVPPLNLESSIANGIKYVKAYGGLLQGGVPSGYTAVEYVENATNTLVKTGISFTDSDPSVKLEVQCRTVTGSFYILQARDYVNDNAAAEARSSGTDPDATSTILGISGPASGQKLSGNAGTSSGVTLDNINRIGQKTVSLVFTAENGYQTLYCKDLTNNTEETKTETYNPAGLTRPKTEMCFFGNMAPAYTPSGGGSTVIPNRLTAGCRLYYAKIWKNGVLVRDYVPAVRDSDSAVGLYDRVSHTFIRAADGSLTAGNSLAPTPSDPVDLVCNNGKISVLDHTNWNVITNPTSQPGQGIFINTSGVLSKANDRGAGVFIPVTVGKQYTLLINKKNTALGTIIRYGQSNNGDLPNSAEQLLDWYRGSIEDMMIISFTAKRPYFVMQLAADFVEAGGIDEAVEVIEAQGDNETIAIRTRNLANVATDIDGYYIGADGSIVASANSCYSDIIPVVAGKTYTWSGICGGSSYNNKRVHAYIDGVWNQQVAYEQVTTQTPFAISFTVPAGCNGIRISHFNNDTETQVELGSTKTAYIAYNDSTAGVANLLKIASDADTHEILTGAINHKIGIRVLDGTEDWVGTTAAGVSWYMADVLDKNMFSHLVCTHFVNDVVLSADNTVYKSAGASMLQIRYDTASDLTAFKSWLASQYSAGTPVIVVYGLETPYEEPAPVPQTMQTVAGDNTLDIVQAGMSGLEVEVKYTKG